MKSRSYEVSALSDGGFQKPQAAAVERGCRRVIHLVSRDLEHLIFEIDRVAGRPGLESPLAIIPKALSPTRRCNMTAAGAHHGQRSRRSGGAGAIAIEFRFDQIARL